MKKNLDALLTHALAPREEAGDILDQKILEKASALSEIRIADQNDRTERRMNMDYKKMKKASAVLTAAAITAAASITAVAAWQYRSASQVAESLGDSALAENFAQQESIGDGVFDPQIPSGESQSLGSTAGVSQSYGGYKVTMLGLLSGDDLSQFQNKSGDSIRSDRTYCVVAIQKEDGSSVEEPGQNFFVSPLIGGLDPFQYNAASLCGGYSEFVEDSILYRLVACDNITYFADQPLYLCVSDTSFYDNSLYTWDEAAGSISRNAGYEGLNALFDLNVDSALADPEKAKALLEDLEKLWSEDGTEPDMSAAEADAMEWAGKLTGENLDQYCVRMENTVQTVGIDKDGNYVIQPWLVNEAVSDSAGGDGEIFNSKYYALEYYPAGQLNINNYSCSERGMEDLVITTFTLNKDGTMTFAAWVPREGSMFYTGQ